MRDRVGFMQGRLSPLVDGRIQAFPWKGWQEEFPVGQETGFHLMEWTLDQERLRENPLLTVEGQTEILRLCARHDFRIPSLTGDCFMQAPFWKATGDEFAALVADFRAVAQACSAVGAALLVIPLVDNGRLESRNQEDLLIGALEEQTEFLAALGVKVAFECDFGPEELARFIARLNATRYGINYDIGNSAALGMTPVDEIAAYGERILNVHIKDRMLAGSTVPLGTGNADFDAVFESLGRLRYQGNYILQTARAADDRHTQVLCSYRDMAVNWIKQHGA